VVFMAAMGEVEAEYVRAGLEKLGEHFGGGTGGAKGRDDLGAAMAA
jgi:hypothetical protein